MNKWTTRGAAALTAALLTAGLTACGSSAPQPTNEAAAQSLGDVRPMMGISDIGPGATGYGVKCVQVAANWYQSPRITVDSAFGPATKAAVKRYQRSRHLTADGVVGPKTGRAMTSDVRKSYEIAHHTGDPADTKPYRTWLSRCNGVIPT
ncbi:peptidoglycan-binding domain-containing protein [Streptomyces sp. NPDC050095]|uniref:peptidoglycan-binding domain-containing protein n=1 Tax=unclassified Streptomyces TaxID=2593676 RepID=UPI00341E6B51